MKDKSNWRRGINKYLAIDTMLAHDGPWPRRPFPEIKCYGGLAKEKKYNMNLYADDVKCSDDMKKLKMYFQTLWNIV